MEKRMDKEFKEDGYMVHILSECSLYLPIRYPVEATKTSREMGYYRSSRNHGKPSYSYTGFGFSKDIGTDIAIASLLYL